MPKRPRSYRTYTPKSQGVTKMTFKPKKYSSNTSKMKQSPEMKYFETAISDTAITSTWDEITPSINLVPQGTTDVTRIGTKINVKKIQIKLQIATDNNIVVDDSVRICVYLDKQANGAACTGTDIYLQDNIRSWRNISNAKRFKVLCDDTIDIPINAVLVSPTTVVTRLITWNKYLKVDEVIEIDNADGTITGMRSYNYGIMAVSNQATLNFTGTVRIRYFDQ